MTYRFCFTFGFALYDFWQFSWRILVFGLPSKQVWKAALPIVNLDFSNENQINPLCNCTIIFLRWIVVSAFFFPCGLIKHHANSPEKYPSNLIQQLLKLFLPESVHDSRTFTLNQNCRFCLVRTLCKMQNYSQNLFAGHLPSGETSYRLNDKKFLLTRVKW
jgi:hypothetical protein